MWISMWKDAVKEGPDCVRQKLPISKFWELTSTTYIPVSMDYVKEGPDHVPQTLPRLEYFLVFLSSLWHPCS